MTSGPTPMARGGCGDKAHPLAARPKRRVLEKIPGQLEALFFILLTLGLIKQSNTPESSDSVFVRGANDSKYQCCVGLYVVKFRQHIMIHQTVREFVIKFRQHIMIHQTVRIFVYMLCKHYTAHDV